jgi:hypothetical protein
MLVSRVPVYGELQFLDRGGKPAEKGVNVGDEWTYRTFIEGNTQATAIWTFQGITPRRFPDGLPVELYIDVFRTHKGDLEKGVAGSLVARNPRTRQEFEVAIFAAKKLTTDEQFIRRKLRAKDGTEIDLFKDLVDDGKLEIQLRCVEHSAWPRPTCTSAPATPRSS